jgi:hypothetical protein
MPTGYCYGDRVFFGSAEVVIWAILLPFTNLVRRLLNPSEQPYLLDFDGTCNVLTLALHFSLHRLFQLISATTV